MKPSAKTLFPVRSIRLQFTQAPVLAFAALLIVGSQSAQAQLTWNSAGPSNNWSTAAGNENWLPGNVVWTQNSSAIFDGSSGAPEAIGVTTVNIFDNLTFNISGFSITSAGAGSFVLANDLASTITVTNLADSAAIAETIANNSGLPSTLTKAGAGTLNLNGTAANSYSGGTILSAGTLIASHEGSLGQGPLTNNATLNLNKANITFSGISTSMTGNGTTNVIALGTGTNTVGLNGDYSGYTGSWNIGVGAVAGAGKVQINGLDNASTTITILPNGTVYSSDGTHNASVILKGGDTGESLGQLRIDGTTANWAGPITIDGVMTGTGDGIVGSNSGPAIISGVISELNGPRELTKAGGGTLVFTRVNTYSGPTRILAGKISVANVNNAGANGPLGSNGTVSLGGTTNSGTLLYSGSGEVTDKVINLGGTSGNGAIELASPSGVFKFTQNITATGLGSKSLALTGSTAGTGEFAGQIIDQSTVDSTTLSTSFAAAATTITLASVDGINVGTSISGTGLAGGTTVSAINAGTKVVTLNLATSGAGTAGQIITATGLINRTGLLKDGTGVWKVTGNNSFTGGVNINAGQLIITNSNALGAGTKTVTLSNGTAGNPQLQLDGSSGSIVLPSSISYRTSNTFSAVSSSILNLAGNNTLAGTITLTSGGGGTRLVSNAGKLSVSGNITSDQTTGRSLDVRGAGDGEISGIISNGSGAYPVGKDGSGTWTLSGNNTYTGTTTVSNGTLILAGSASNFSSRSVNAGTLIVSGDYSGASGSSTVNGGTLKLDYSSIDSGKLGDSDALIMSGGTLELAGGTHAENVGSTTLTTGTTSLITRSSGTATLNLKTVTGNGSLVLSQSSIATTDNPNINGILPWARVLVSGVSVLATNSTNTFDGPIVPYAGFSDVTRLGVAAMPNAPAANVRIINGGSAGNITLSGSPRTQINFLQMTATDGAATIAPTAATDVFSIGSETGGTVWQNLGAGSLILGTTANDGVLTTGDTDTGAPATLSLINDSSNPLIVNSTISNNASDVVSLTLGGSGPVIANGLIASTGSITVGGSTVATLNGNIPSASGINNGSSGLLTFNGNIGGTSTIAATGGNIVLNGNNSFTGVLTVNNGRTVTLTGDNSLRPSATNSLTTIANGGTLQLQANTSNTVGGVSSALSNEQTANQPLTLSNGGLLQLRSDSNVTFTGGNNIGGLGSATVNFDVDQLTGAGNGNTLTLAPLGFSVNTTTINVSGGHGYGLSLGKITNLTGVANSVTTLNPTTGNLSVAGYTGTTAFTSTLVLSGASAGNFVTGPITNTTSATPSVISLTKNGPSTWTLLGANTYTGTTTLNDGTLKAGNAASFNNTGALAMGGAGVLDLNGFNVSFTNINSSNTANLITDSSAGAGTSTLAVNAQANTVAALIKDGPSKAVQVTLLNANSGVTPFLVTNANTFSGGLTLLNQTSGTRLRISAAPVTVGSPGAIVSSPFGTGPITIGLANTHKAGILLDTANNFTIVNDIVFNTALGTDQPGIRLDTVGHIFSGTITANLSNALFGNTGAARLTGKITGSNGFQLSASAVSVTLSNSAGSNDYLGDTTLGAGSTLILGAVNQIPDGVSKGSVTNNGTLNLAGFSETINGLSGNGTVVSSSGSPTFTVGNNDSSGISSGSTGGSLSFVKIGSGIQSLGSVGHSGDTTVSGGILSITGASNFADGAAVRLTTGTTLNLTAAGTDVVNALFIDGTAQATGIWGKIGSGAAHETSLITGNGLLSVTTSGSTPYSAWALAKGLTPANNAPTADPDFDGKTNLQEFGFDGNPLSGVSDGKIVGKVAPVGSDMVMTLTLPVRSGATFTGSTEQVSAVIDGVTYRIQGSDTLTNPWGLVITEVLGGDATAIQSGLPALSTGWTYRTFRSPGAVTDGDPSDFLRAGIE